jgi:hypothetical protein
MNGLEHQCRGMPDLAGPPFPFFTFIGNELPLNSEDAISLLRYNFNSF